MKPERTGIAIGIPDIRTDAIDFRYQDQTWSFPTYDVVGRIAHYNGVAYEAPVKKLIALAKKKGSHGLRRH